MAEVSKDATLIRVHGREGLNIPYTRYHKTATGREVQVDISGSDIFLEIPAADLRVQLLPNNADPMGLLIQLTRLQVAAIPTTATEFVVIDESGIVPKVEWDGKIQRIGYTEQP
jgi:hypothetical protein